MIHIFIKKITKTSFLIAFLFCQNSYTGSQSSEDILLDAIQTGKVEEVRKRIRLGTRPDQVKDSAGNKPLALAAMIGNEEMVQLFLDENANPNDQNNNGYTALMFAASRGHKAVVKKLLAAKADPNIKTKKDQFTALILAIQPNGKTDADIVKMLLDAKADAKAQDKLGDTPLSRAKGQEKIIKLLKTAGA